MERPKDKIPDYLLDMEETLLLAQLRAPASTTPEGQPESGGQGKYV